ncbi:ABC transporter ATP-binding protein [Candidatus Margulisiibacteriota bacterium]
MTDTVIKIENLYKEYRLGVISHGTLRHDLQSWWARIRKKEDPNSLVSIHHNKETERNNILALNNVSFSVKQGEVLGIIGRNGAGKSTILKILSKITAPTKGNVKIKGRVGSLLEVGTGFHPELTGRENIYLNGAILGMNQQEINNKIKEIIDFAGIEKFVDTPVKRYSSGMHVRLAFAVAAHLEPEILVIDEVLAVGDVAFQKKCLGKIEDVSKKDGRTILFVSHNMQALKDLCPKALWIDQGQIMETGDSSTVIGNYLKKMDQERELLPINARAEKTFEVNQEDAFQVVSAKVLNEHGILSENLSCDEPIIIEVICQVNQPITDMYGWLQITNVQGQVLMAADSRESGLNNVENLPAGKHKINITIPPRILGFGDYLVRISFADYVGNNLVPPLGHVCSFHLDDTSSLRKNKRGSLLSTLYKWDIS